MGSRSLTTIENVARGVRRNRRETRLKRAKEALAKMRAKYNGQFSFDVSKFKTVVQRITIICKKCTCRFRRILIDFMRGKSCACPSCGTYDYEKAGIARRKPLALYKKELKTVHPKTKILSDYNENGEILHLCPWYKSSFWKRTLFVLKSAWGTCPTCARYKIALNRYTKKEITVAGRKYQVQGYEPQAVEMLLETYPGKSLVIGCGVPRFKYKDGSEKTYIPDLYIPKANLIVEVKSIVTIGLNSREIFEMVRKKCKAVLRAKFKFRMMCISQKGRLLRLPKRWFDLSWSTFKKRFAKVNNYALA